MATVPSALPEWASNPTAGDIVEPLAAKKQSGWTKTGGIPEKPPYQWFNWHMNLSYQWHQYFSLLIAGDGTYTTVGESGKILRLLGANATVTGAGAATFADSLSVGTAGTAGPEKITRSGTTWRIGGTTSTITEDGVFSGASFAATGDTSANRFKLSSGGTAQPTYLSLSGTTWRFGGTSSTITEAGTATFAEALSVGTSGSAATTKITRSGTVWQIGGTSSTINETGAAAFAVSVDSPIFKNTAASALDIMAAASQAIKFAAGGASSGSHMQIASAGEVTIYRNLKVTGDDTSSGANQGVFAFNSGTKIYCYGPDASNQGTFQIRLRAPGGTDYLALHFLATGECRIPSVYTLNTANPANVYVDTSGGLSRSTASSLRYKENIVAYPKNALAKVKLLKPVTFNYKKSYCKDTSLQIGFIAEQVAEVESLLAIFENGVPENVRYGQVTSLLTAAMQELVDKVEALELKQCAV